jgi:hypothetical protein
MEKLEDRRKVFFAYFDTAGGRGVAAAPFPLTLSKLMPVLI